MDFLMTDPIAVHFAFTGWVGAGAVLTDIVGKIMKSQDANKRQTFGWQESAEERDYIRRLREMSDRGSIDVPGLTNMASRTAAQRGNETGQAVTGRLIGQGLEKSIVATEMKRRIGRDTLRSIADQSRKIRIRNEESKVDALDKLGDIGRARSERMMRIMELDAEANKKTWLSSLGDLIRGGGTLMSWFDKFKGGGAGGNVKDWNEVFKAGGK